MLGYTHRFQKQMKTEMVTEETFRKSSQWIMLNRCAA